MDKHVHNVLVRCIVREVQQHNVHHVLTRQVGGQGEPELDGLQEHNVMKPVHLRTVQAERLNTMEAAAVTHGIVIV